MARKSKGLVVRGINEALEGIEQLGKDQPKVLARALNKTAQGGRTDTVRLVRTQLNLKAGVVRNSISISRATWKRPEAELTVTGPNLIPLYRFSPRPSRPEQRKHPDGVAVKVHAKKPASRVKGSFIARYKKSGDVGVFKRPKGSKRAFVQLRAVGHKVLLRHGAIRRNLQRKLHERLEKNLLHEIKFLHQQLQRKIGKLKGGA